eukprot:scaffold602_cov342-Prasinococcus_capsulatus_cf.AAC.15
MYQLLPGRNGLALTHTKKHSTSWYKYTHDSRLLLLATGTQVRAPTAAFLSCAWIACSLALQRPCRRLRMEHAAE